jgi:outer membrane cobalamin receptor
LNDVNDLGWSIKYRMASAHQWLEYWRSRTSFGASYRSPKW